MTKHIGTILVVSSVIGLFTVPLIISSIVIVASIFTFLRSYKKEDANNMIMSSIAVMIGAVGIVGGLSLLDHGRSLCTFYIPSHIENWNHPCLYGP